jgi:hypothetical protein
VIRRTVSLTCCGSGCSAAERDRAQPGLERAFDWLANAHDARRQTQEEIMKRVVFAALVGIAVTSAPSPAQGGIEARQSATGAGRDRAARAGDAEILMRRGPGDGSVVFGSRPGERRRTYIDANGLECDERVVVKQNGDREYDLKCREQRQNRGRGNAGRYNDRDVCYDRNRDGRCDVGWDIGRAYPTALPDMLGALLFDQGRRTDEVIRWLGNGAYDVRYTDRDRNRRPELVSWTDAGGALVQQWIDANGDGRADVVRIYRGGQLARVIGQ